MSGNQLKFHVQEIKGSWPAKMAQGVVIKVKVAKKSEAGGDQIIDQAKTVPVEIPFKLMSEAKGEEVTIEINSQEFSLEIPGEPSPDQSKDYEIRVYVCRKKLNTCCFASSTKNIASAGLFLHQVEKYCKDQKKAMQYAFKLFETDSNETGKTIKMDIEWIPKAAAAEGTSADADPSAKDQDEAAKKIQRKFRQTRKTSGSPVKKILGFGLLGAAVGAGASFLVNQQ
mmetsp:Transcript_27557/g.94107  ORF Transcript_27557/g.94107 Transcript_27557/m.94107 type:complete len:227 (-) Transcript_27557:236-916(-)